MAEGTVGAINVEIRAKADRLDRDLRTNERKVVDSANRMDKGMRQALDFGRVVAGLTAVASAATVILNGIDLVAARIAGSMKDADDAVIALEQSMRAVPVLGQVFGLGNALGERIFGDKADAAAVTKQGAQAEKNRLQMLKQQEMAVKRIQTMTREIAILNAKDDQERLRLQAQFKLEDATSGLQGVSQDKADEIRRLAEQRFRLETQAGGLAAGTGRGQEIGARTALSTRPPDQQQPNKRQVDITNQLLQNIARVLAAQDNVARAN